jgi:hypothetical protein
MDAAYADKFWQKAVVRDGCWGWKDKPYSNGYPYLQVGRKGPKLRASRVSYFIKHGYWPTVVRHTCDNPICTNPDHLLDGTQLDNINDRRVRFRARNQNINKTHCVRGHEFTEENTYVSKKQRHCRKCAALRAKERRVIKMKMMTQDAVIFD